MSDDYYFDLYDWRNVIASPAGPPSPTTRHVLLTLSLHMNPKGIAWPSQKMLARRSGLALRTVKAALDDAEKRVWVIRKFKGRNGQGWRLTQYRGVFPGNVDLADKPWENDSRWIRGAADAPPFDPDPPNVVQTAKDVVQLTTERGATDDRNVVQQLPTNSSSELLMNSPYIEGPAHSRSTHCVEESAGRELGAQPDLRTASLNGSDTSVTAPEVRQGRKERTVKTGLAIFDVCMTSGNSPETALEQVQRMGYPVTIEHVRAHLAQRGAA